MLKHCIISKSSYTDESCVMNTHSLKGGVSDDENQQQSEFSHLSLSVHIENKYMILFGFLLFYMYLIDYYNILALFCFFMQLP